MIVAVAETRSTYACVSQIWREIEIAPLRPRETATVRCPDCGESREISIRQRRRLLNNNGNMLCSVCRTLPNPAQVKLHHKRYWLDNYSMEWIQETADMIWGRK